MQLLMLQTYTDEDVPTEMRLSPYVANEEPTAPFVVTKADAIWEAQERARVGNHEAEGFWLLVASAL